MPTEIFYQNELRQLCYFYRKEAKCLIFAEFYHLWAAAFFLEKKNSFELSDTVCFDRRLKQSRLVNKKYNHLLIKSLFFFLTELFFFGGTLTSRACFDFDTETIKFNQSRSNKTAFKYTPRNNSLKRRMIP